MILITGVCGFIGFHLAKQSLKSNKEIIGIDCIDNYYPQKQKPWSFEFQGSLKFCNVMIC